MGGGHEIERQWLAPAGTRLPDRVGDFTAGEPETRLIVDTYYDTADRALNAVRGSLRVRDQDGLLLATFKRSLAGDFGGGVRRRVELESALDCPRDEHPAFRAAAELVDAPLIALGSLHQVRTARAYRAGEHELEAVVDELAFPDGSAQVRVEAEGPEEHVIAFAEALAALVPGLRDTDRGKAQELLARL